MKKAGKSWNKVEVGAHCFYGIIVGVWEDVLNKDHSWVFIKNDDDRLHKIDSFSLYKFLSEVNGGEFVCSHFIPASVIKSIQELGILDCDGASDVLDVCIKKESDSSQMEDVKNSNVKKEKVLGSEDFSNRFSILMFK